MIVAAAHLQHFDRIVRVIGPGSRRSDDQPVFEMRTPAEAVGRHVDYAEPRAAAESTHTFVSLNDDHYGGAISLPNSSLVEVERA